MSDPSSESRRSFFRGLGRFVVAAILTGGVGALIARPGDECDRSDRCRGCPVFDNCRLPQARSSREADR